MDILVFGDQTADQYPVLRKACQWRGNGLLSTFLEHVSVALREEVQQLPYSQRESIPDFLTLSHLVEAYYSKGLIIPQLESCMTTLAQLAHYIGYFDEHPDRFPTLANTRIVGLCTGLLAASAVASSASLADLVPLAVETVRISFRVGSRVGSRMNSLERTDGVHQSWSTIITNTSEKTANEALAEFHHLRKLPSVNHAYISASSLMAVTISGPPSTTRQLFQESSLLQNSNKVPIPIYAPYHANHLYQEHQNDQILSEQTIIILKSHRPRCLIHSSSSGKCFSATNALGLVELALEDILREPVRWDRLIDETVSQVSLFRNSECSITSIGVTNVVHSLASALKAAGQLSISIKDHTAWSTQQAKTAGRTQNDKIAIIGMSGRFPGAVDHEQLWDLLAKGMDVHREVPPDRFDAKAHFDPSGKGKNKSHTQYGCFIEEPGLFDPRFFNMSPREAAQTDPMGRLILVTAYEALEMSGYVPNRTPSTRLHRIGTFYGQTSDDWREINAAEDIDTYFITGGVRAFGPGRINYYFKFSGPSFIVDTACSSSLAAIQLACTSLWAGDCDTACAGGANVLTNPDIFAGLSKGQFLSKTGGCKTYDHDADGYCRGDACGTVILKRYEDAIADKDNILGCILGAATNHSAEAISITHPHAGAQEFLYQRVLENSGVDAHEISYVEMHGTGTQAGDGVEMTSVTNVFAPRHRQRRPDQTLNLGAIKANIGHGEAASGISSLIKVMQMFKKNAIPPNVGIKGVMNKGFPKDLQQRNVHIETTLVPYPRKGAAKRKIFLNNFSAAGGNTAIVLEEGPLHEAPTAIDPRSQHIVTVSGRSIASLKRNIQNLIHHVDENLLDITLPSLSYTTTARRIHHNYRVAVQIDSVSKVKEALAAQLKDTYSPISMVATRTAFVFTGQGAHYAGLGKQLYETVHSFRKDIDELDNLTRIQYFPSFLPLINGTDIENLSPMASQLGMACIQVALWRMWSSWGLKPSLVIGHSLGEYAALHVAGVISVSDMIYLVGHRAQLLVSSCTTYTHGMLAVKSSVEAISAALGEKMPEIACINGPQETVLSGPIEVVKSTNQILALQGFKTTPLDIPFAFHSAQVDSILESFKEIAASVTFKKPNIPILSTLKGDVVQETGVINADYLARHARDPVRFWSALEAGKDQNLFDEKTFWVEIGPHPICSGMVKSSLNGVASTVASLRRNEDPWKTLVTSICALYTAGASFEWNEYHRAFKDAHELLILPSYSFDEKKYWLDYHNNWCLNKGEALVPVSDSSNAALVEQKEKLSTTSCQKIVFEELHANSGTVIIQSDISEPKLLAIVSGHLVNGIPLCPSSLYADMAMTAADYLYRQLRPKAPIPGINVCQVEVHKALIAKIPPPPEGQHIQLEVSADLDQGKATMKFRSVTPEGKVLTDHAYGTIKYEDVDAWREEWSRTQFMVLTQIDLLKQKMATGVAHKILRGMAYKLFSALVTYDQRYRGMEEVILDGQQTEATASVHFQTTAADGTFHCNPYWIDSLAHISGFIVNASDLVDSSNSVYISHGWSSIRISKALDPGKKYRSYVRMQPAPGNVSVGDVYILEEEEVIGMVSGLKFQNIPRRAFNIMCPPPNTQRQIGTVSSKTTNNAQVVQKMPLSKPVKAKTVKSQPQRLSVSVTTSVMKIMAEEIDVDMSELVDDAAFENLGVDSLMALTVSAKLREELSLEISPTLFLDHPTVGSIKGFFAQYDGAASLVEANDSDASGESLDFASPDASSTSTPPSSISTSPPSESGKHGSSQVQITLDDISVARQIIAGEMGVPPFDIVDTEDLTERGMDSLMSLAVLGALREQTGVDLPSTFLISNVCLEDVENALGIRPKPKVDSKPKVRVTAPTAKPSPSPPKLGEANKKLEEICNVSKHPSASSVLLQGNPKIATKSFFLLPDGSGSATSYVSIANISLDVAVYGLNCPFMKTPREFNCGIQGISAIYLKEIQRRQPKGPYIIGGWSAGGVTAYEVTMQLVAKGEVVERLVLLDSPCPVELEPLPSRLHHFFDSIGLLGTGKAGGTPDWLLPHFEYTIKALKEYKPVPIEPSKAPKVCAIWCRDGVCGDPGDPRPPPAEDEDPAPMKWLLDHRTDFGDNGWAQLLPLANFEFAVMDGNHFSMMKGEHGISLGHIIREGLGLIA